MESRDDDLDLAEFSQERKSGQSSSRQHASRPEAMPLDFLVRPQTKIDPDEIRARAKQVIHDQRRLKYLNVQGTTKVTDFAQSFYYLACSICKRATNAYGNVDFWCNYCAKKVPALIKIKFNIQITDATGSIDATVFSEVAAEAYSITPADAIDEKLSLSVLHKLGEPRKCIMILKAYMHNYARIYEEGEMEDEAWSMVQTKGDQFVVNGQPFYVNGFNTYWLMEFAVDQSTRGKVNEVFQQASSVGLTVCRTWAFNDGLGQALQKSPSVYDEEVFKTVLNRVNTLTNITYKDNPTIFAWELMNEPRCDADPSGDKIQNLLLSTNSDNAVLKIADFGFARQISGVWVPFIFSL